eukprot:NODE_1800_length_1376_cov_30.958367_g1708_i0.p1 GENE.NODE_1800_length_1376_cov_30.958367_g1708_i0~~NODE_1800_length_1376_cov_30.958367_g1708_i0.p1  ORF type:complete len:326 (-),score=85.31 NODE_1800_length_1376_cov_30.958367_g1708_i0:340-1317(-)
MNVWRKRKWSVDETAEVSCSTFPVDQGSPAATSSSDLTVAEMEDQTPPLPACSSLSTPTAPFSIVELMNIIFSTESLPQLQLSARPAPTLLLSCGTQTNPMPPSTPAPSLPIELSFRERQIAYYAVLRSQQSTCVPAPVPVVPLIGAPSDEVNGALALEQLKSLPIPVVDLVTFNILLECAFRRLQAMLHSEALQELGQGLATLTHLYGQLLPHNTAVVALMEEKLVRWICLAIQMLVADQAPIESFEALAHHQELCVELCNLLCTVAWSAATLRPATLVNQLGMALVTMIVPFWTEGSTEGPPVILHRYHMKVCTTFCTFSTPC